MSVCVCLLMQIHILVFSLQTATDCANDLREDMYNIRTK